MDFELSEEHLALRESARALIAQRWDRDKSRLALDRPPARMPDSLWKEIASLGWIGVAGTEELGGSGGDLMAALVLAEEAGRGLLPGPFLPALAAGIALDRSAADDQRAELLGHLFAGDRVLVGAYDEPGGTWGPGSLHTTVTPTHTGLVVDGVKILVPDADRASAFVLSGRAGDSTVLAVVPSEATGVEVIPMNRFDGQSMAEVRFASVEVKGSTLIGPGRTPGGGQPADDAYDISTLVCAADLLGVSEAALAMATGYAKDRVQFGHPIGSYQAISHRLADLVVDTELGRSLLFGACLAMAEARDEAPRLVSAAKAWMSDTAIGATETALHVHGGIGFTWELDVHLYLRRARSGAASFGDANFHRDRIATLLAARDPSRSGPELT